MFEAFGISVAASIMAVLILAVGKVSLDNFLRNYGYKLAFAHIQDVSGTWEGSNKDQQGNVMYEQIKLKQRGSLLEGVIEYEITYTNGSNKKKQFQVQGIIKNTTVALIYHNANRRERGVGSICLELINDGSTLSGHYAVFDVELNEIATSTNNAGGYRFTKKNG